MQEMKIILILLIVVGCFFNVACSRECDENSHSLILNTLIPNEDILLLDTFFQALIKTEGLGYALYGSKPVCLAPYFDSIPFGNLLFGGDRAAIKRGWKIWQKYEKYFPHPRYLIFEEHENVDGTDIQSIYFINKKNVIESLKKNASIFKNELEDFNLDKFLLKIEEGKSLLKIINNHEGLLGILLGYGAESSMSYCQRDLMWNSKLPILYEEIDLEGVSSPPSLLINFIHPIYFEGDPQSEEVKNILEKNVKERAYLQQIYSEGKFLGVTLQKLMEK